MKTTDFITEGIGQDADDMHKDHEVQMARQDCYNAAKDAIDLHKLLANVSEMQGLEGWVSEKITLAADYLRTVKEYFEYEQMSQEQSLLPEFTFEDAEAQMASLLEDTSDEAMAAFLAKGGEIKQGAYKQPRKSEKTDYGSKHIGGAGDKMRASRTGVAAKTQGTKIVGMAEEQLDELSPELLGRYKKAASAASSAADKAGDYDLGHKRYKGIIKATKKQFAHDVKKHQDVEEGVAETLPMSDAVKVLKHYGADHFKTTTNELHFYKNGKPFSVDLVMNPDTTRSVTLSSLNAATRGLKGQGIAEATPYALSAANANAEFERTKTFVPRGYKGRVDVSVMDQEEYRSVMAALQKAAKLAGQHIECGLSGNEMSVFSKTMDTNELDEFIDDTLAHSELDEGRVDSPVSAAITRRIVHQHTGLLAKYGPQAVMDAIDQVADWVDLGPDDEIGTSDVSAWVQQVIRYVQTSAGEGITESAGGTGAGGIASVVSTLGGKAKGPGTGVPKKASNILKRVSPQIGKGIYK